MKAFVTLEGFKDVLWLSSDIYFVRL